MFWSFGATTYCYLKCIVYDKLFKHRQSFRITLHIYIYTYLDTNLIILFVHNVDVSFVVSKCVVALRTQAQKPIKTPKWFRHTVETVNHCWKLFKVFGGQNLLNVVTASYFAFSGQSGQRTFTSFNLTDPFICFKARNILRVTIENIRITSSRKFNFGAWLRYIHSDRVTKHHVNNMIAGYFSGPNFLLLAIIESALN